MEKEFEGMEKIQEVLRIHKPSSFGSLSDYTSENPEEGSPSPNGSGGCGQCSDDDVCPAVKRKLQDIAREAIGEDEIKKAEQNIKTNVIKHAKIELNRKVKTMLDDIDSVLDEKILNTSRTIDTIKVNKEKLPVPDKMVVHKEFDKIFTYLNNNIPVYLVGPTGVGKALALDTPVPTPEGWSTMGDLCVGDSVFDENGNKCKVITKSEIFTNHDCYEITFGNGEKVIADGGHRWKIQTKSQRINGEKVKNKFSIMTTEEMINNVDTNWKNPKKNLFIDSALSLKIEDKNLPIEPYLLGFWLGDGDSHNASIVTNDYEELLIILRENNPEYDFDFGKFEYDNAKRINISNGFYIDLKNNNLLKNKHIPKIYFRASYNQRMKLIAGLMDSDGSIYQSRGKTYMSFKNKNENIAYGFLDLLRSCEIISRIYKKDDEEYGGKIYDVKFISNNSNISKLNRYKNQITDDRKVIDYHTIYNIKKIDSVPVQCISVDSDSHLFLCTKSYIPTHNTHMGSQLADVMKLKYYMSSQVTDEYQLLGFIDGMGNYQDTPFYNAFTKGGLFLFDELDASVPEALVKINMALANESMAFPNGIKKKHKNFRVIAGGNTIGGADSMYTARSRPDGATMNRFTIVKMDYDPHMEKYIITTDTAILFNTLREFVNKQRTIEVDFSTRAAMYFDTMRLTKIPLKDLVSEILLPFCEVGDFEDFGVGVDNELVKDVAQAINELKRVEV